MAESLQRLEAQADRNGDLLAAVLDPARTLKPEEVTEEHYQES